MAEGKIYATVEEAVEDAGTTVLSRLDAAPTSITREDLKEYLKGLKPEILGYAGPYTDVADQRNVWTAAQDMDEVVELPPGDEEVVTESRRRQRK